MSTKSVATTLGRVERVDPQVSHAGLRNWLLDALTLSSGAIDAISFLGLGKVFTAFMTGNVAFLGMAIAANTGVSPIAPPHALWVLSSMGGFAAGIFLATVIVRSSRQPNASKGNQPTAVVWPRSATLVLGTSLLPHLCFAGTWVAAGGHPADSVIPALLALWALAMGMQSAAVRQLNLGGIFTTAATATYIFLVSDWANHRPLMGDEHRRFRGVLVSLFTGATAGGLLLIHAPMYAPVFPFVITLVVVVTAATAFRARREKVSAEAMAA